MTKPCSSGSFASSSAISSSLTGSPSSATGISTIAAESAGAAPFLAVAVSAFFVAVLAASFFGAFSTAFLAVEDVFVAAFELVAFLAAGFLTAVVFDVAVFVAVFVVALFFTGVLAAALVAAFLGTGRALVLALFVGLLVVPVFADLAVLPLVAVFTLAPEVFFAAALAGVLVLVLVVRALLI